MGEWVPHRVWQCGVQTRQSQCDLSLNTGADGSEDYELGLGMGLVQDGFLRLLRQTGKRNGFSFRPGRSNWLAAMAGEQIHVGTLIHVGSEWSSHRVPGVPGGQRWALAQKGGFPPLWEVPVFGMTKRKKLINMTFR